MLLGSLHMHCRTQRLLAKYAKNTGKTEVSTMIYSCSSSKSVQRYFTCGIILWKNNVFSRRRLRTPACIDFGRLLARFGRVWASKLQPCWLKLGLHWASSCDFLASFGRSWRLELVLNFNKSRFESAGDGRRRPGGLPARFGEPSSRDFLSLIHI